MPGHKDQKDQNKIDAVKESKDIAENNIFNTFFGFDIAFVYLAVLDALFYFFGI